MNKELESFDFFVDDIISSEDNLLKGELDLLLMQYLFESLDLEKFNDYDKYNNLEDYSESYLAAQRMLKFFYNNFWYPVFGKILSKFVFLIEGNTKKKSIDKSMNIKNQSLK